MPLVTTQRSGLVDQVIGQMRAAISGGEWPVGERIPPEPELVTALGVGRNTVREAVRALSHAGLLEVRQGDGTFVRATSEISGAVRKLCGAELREVLQVRRALEVEGSRLAAVERSESELRALRRVLDIRNRAYERDDLAEFVRTDTEFHQLVVQCGHNAVLWQLHRGMTEAVTASVAATTDTHGRCRDFISHDGLLAAIADADPDRAAAEAGGFLKELLGSEAAESPSAG